MKLLDTSAVIDIDRGGVDAKVQQLDEQGRHAISMVTVTELHLGVAIKYERGTDRYQQARDDLDRLIAPVRGATDHTPSRDDSSRDYRNAQRAGRIRRDRSH